MRKADLHRKTNETDIQIGLNLDGELLLIHQVFHFAGLLRDLGVLRDAFGESVETSSTLRCDLDLDDGADHVHAELLLVDHGAIAEDDVILFEGPNPGGNLGLGEVKHRRQLSRLEGRVVAEQLQQWIHAARLSGAPEPCTRFSFGLLLTPPR